MDASFDEKDEEVRPWEQPGAVRRDCEPHRGPLLRALALTSSVLGLLLGVLAPPLVAHGIASLPTLTPPAARQAVLSVTSLASCGYLIEFALAVLVWVLTRQDLHRMDAGLMDPEGREPIHCARQATFVGVVFSSFGLAVICLMVCADWAVLRR